MNRNEQMEKAFATIVKRVNQAIATDDSQFLTGALLHIRDIAKAALALPRRNCDVGTAEKEYARFREHCTKCEGCRSYGRPELLEEVCLCALRWAQMPYEAEGGTI